MSTKNQRRPSATILIADDDVCYGTALAELLAAEGHAVHHVLDGEEALKVLREMGERLDLIICDLLLPRQSGFDVAREIREMDMPIRMLAVTGVYSNAREIHALRSMGVTGYVHKSTPFDQVVFRVNNVLFPSTDNQRGNPRVAVSLPVQFRIGDVVHYGTSYNLSVSGMYVRTAEPVIAGAIIEMAIALPTARDMVPVAAEIVHSATPAEVRGTAYPAGFGARYVTVSPLAQAAIRNFVEMVHAEETTGERPMAKEPVEA